MMKDDIIKKILANLTIEDFIKKIYLVGSLNFNRSTLNDIDLIIILENDIEPFKYAFEYSEQAMSISKEIGIFVSPFFANENTFQKSNAQFFSNVKSSGMLIYG